MSRTRWIVLLISLTILVLLIWFVGDLVIYLLIAGLIALIGRPLVDLLCKVKIKKWQMPSSVAAVISMLVIFGTFALIFTFFIPKLFEQTQQLEKIDPQAIEQGLEEPIAYVENFVREYQLADLEEGQSIEEAFQETIVEVASSLNLSNIFSAIAGITGDLFIGLFSILFITFFFLKEPDLIQNVFMSITPDEQMDKTNNALFSIRELLTRYFIGLLLELILVGALCALGFSLLGVENAIVIGFFAGLFNVIPYLGPLIGGTTSVSMAVLGALGMDFYSGIIPLALKVLVVFIIVQLLDNFIFQPMIYSNSVKAHPLEIFLVILGAGTLFGVGGMILAIPTYTVFRVIAREFFSQFKIIQSMTRSMED